MSSIPSPWDVIKLIHRLRRSKDLPALDNRLFDGLIDNLLKGKEPSKYELATAKKWGILNDD